jgi:hypothetical protein
MIEFGVSFGWSYLKFITLEIYNEQKFLTDYIKSDKW